MISARDNRQTDSSPDRAVNEESRGYLRLSLPLPRLCPCSKMPAALRARDRFLLMDRRRMKTHGAARSPGGFGRRLANSIRNATYPKAGDSLNATALVWSKAPVIVGAHNAGLLDLPRDGFWRPSQRKPPENPCAAGVSPRANGKTDQAACASSIAGAGPACWWPRGG